MAGTLNENDEQIVAQMHKNKESMRRIERLFFISGVVCILVNIYCTVLGALLVPASLGWSKKFFILDTVGAITSVVCSILSSCKRKNWTVWALSLFIVRALTAIVIYGLMAGIPMMVIGVVPQYLCLRKYKELDFLKTQFGYPGFSPEIYMHRARRMMSDEEVRERMKQTANVTSNDFDGILPPDTGEEYEDVMQKRIKPPLD